MEKRQKCRQTLTLKSANRQLYIGILIAATFCRSDSIVCVLLTSLQVTLTKVARKISYGSMASGDPDWICIKHL